MSFIKLTSEELRKHKGISFPGVTTVFICYDAEGRVFLAQRSKNSRDEQGNWDFGGGGLKHGQSIIDNLHRELKEEYNFTPKNTEFIGYMDVFRKNNDDNLTHWLAMPFAVLVDPAELKINETEMVDDYGWFTLDKLPSPMHSSAPTFLKMYGDKLREIIERNTSTRPLL